MTKSPAVGTKFQNWGTALPAKVRLATFLGACALLPSVGCSAPAESGDGDGDGTSGGGSPLLGVGGSLGATGGSSTGGIVATGGTIPDEEAPPVQVDQDPIASPSLLPVPVSVTEGVGHIHLSENTRLVGAGEAERAATALAEVLRPSTGYSLPIVPGPERRGDIIFAIDASLTSLGEEGYVLDVEDERVRVRATTGAGLFYGAMTLRQLLPPEVESSSLVAGKTFKVPRVTIEDSPRYLWRGLSFDVARHFFDVEEILRLIDLAAMHKLNRLHLHLTDDQGWRIAIDSWPNLATHGGSTQVGGGPGGYFTKEDYASLVAYADERSITIVPEIDVPGHTNAALASYGQLNPSGNPTALYTGTDVGFSSLWLGQQVTLDFVDDVLGEVAALTTGPYLHIGGDEAHATEQGAYNTFIGQVQDMVDKYNKTMVGWCEIGNAPIDAGTIVQDWYRNFETCGGTGAGVGKGASVIFSPAEHAYLDMKYDESTPFGHSWAGYVTVQEAYEWSPSRPEVPSDKVLGVEAAVWTEFIDNRQAVDQMVFPRLSGHAEIGWSPQAGRSWSEYRVRLAHHGLRLEQRGVDFYRSPQVEWE